MRPHGTASELERRRRLAVERVHEGYPAEEVAEFLGVSARAVRGWVAAHRAGGDGGLTAPPVPGRPPKLTPRQRAAVLGWPARRPSALGFPTDLWTAARVAALIERRWQVQYNPRYLADWLRANDRTPQKPVRVPRGRDADAVAVAAWVATDWPRVQKTPAGGRRT